MQKKKKKKKKGQKKKKKNVENTRATHSANAILILTHT
jgi:hypothetical protein